MAGIGSIATTINILEEAGKRNAALASLASSPLPDELKAEIFLNYKKLKRKQMIILPIISVAWFLFVAFTLVFFFYEQLKTFNLFVKILVGALIVLPIYLFFRLIFKEDTPWDKYYTWYREGQSSASLLQMFGIEEETIEEENQRMIKKMNAEGKTKEQIEALTKARSEYQLKKGLRQETEAEENARIRLQMKEAGYTDEQINQSFSR